MALSTVEVIALLIWAIGLVCAITGIVSRSFTFRDGLAALLLALMIPVVGSAAAIVLYATRRRSAPTPRATS